MTKAEIWKRVEELRTAHASLKADKIPLDLISFAELELRLDLIPYDLLKKHFGADAAILADFSGLYIDGEVFDGIDQGRKGQANRLRFSLAHELGHLFLHRELFEAAAITSGEHFLDWLNEHNGKKYTLNW